MDIEKQPFGETPEGKSVDLFVLKNDHGMTAKIMTYGGIVVSLEVPDRERNLADVVLGYENLDGYLNDPYYLGALIGRCGNRISGACFELDGQTYQLAKNAGENHLHGGIKGFDKVIWSGKAEKTAEAVCLKLTYLSKDGEEGYPGNLNTTVIFSLTNDNELKIQYEASTDKATPVNLTHHGYFNLAGQGNGNVLGHELTVAADSYTAMDEDLIVTGEIEEVKDTPLDFTTPHTIGERIDQLDNGYDFNYVLINQDGSLARAAHVFEQASGRIMDVYTTEPGMQLYTGNFLDGSVVGKDGNFYNKHHGFCLETQHHPDSPNKPQFPSVILRPGETYRQTTIYKFGVK